ncbi:glucuronosyltransferase [Sarracenia purpurea var. burkii]
MALLPAVLQKALVSWAYSQLEGISHYAPAQAVLKALADQGHDVTVITSYPQKPPVDNFRDIDVSEVVGVATKFTQLRDCKNRFAEYHQ